MNKSWTQSPNFRLFIMLIVLITVFVVFLGMYLKSYFGYYKELYDYRNDIIDSITKDEENTIKPYYRYDDIHEGNLTAKVKVFEYADMSCQACKALQPEMQKLVNFYGTDKILHVWRDLPITGADNNIEAHQAVHCANDQGKFNEYKNSLYEYIGQYDQSLFISVADKLAMNKDEFSICMSTEKYKSTVEKNYREALRMGLDSTPTLFINDTEVTSNYTFENLRNIAEQTR